MGVGPLHKKKRKEERQLRGEEEEELSETVSMWHNITRTHRGQQEGNANWRRRRRRGGGHEEARDRGAKREEKEGERDKERERALTMRQPDKQMNRKLLWQVLKNLSAF